MSARTRAHLDGFVDALGAAGIEVTPLRRIDFLKALTLVELASIGDLYWTTRIALASHVDQLPVFDTIFAAWFNGGPACEEVAHETEEEDSDPPRPPEESSASSPADNESDGTGKEASLDALLSRPALSAASPEKRAICRDIARTARQALPLKLSRRRKPSSRGGSLDLRRTLAVMRRNGGDMARLVYRERPLRQRRVLMLIDVSGSLKETSPDALRAAHALMTAARDVEVFTFGTRLTRISKTLRHRDMDAALAKLANVIFDFDGGTRIGPSFASFLDDARFAGLARGALVIVVSDGLERGDVDAMAATTERLARLSHRLVWLTPLRSDPHYRPATRGMQAILGALDRLGDASTLQAFLNELVDFDTLVERPLRRGAQRVWRQDAAARRGGNLNGERKRRHDHG